MFCSLGCSHLLLHLILVVIAPPVKSGLSWVCHRVPKRRLSFQSRSRHFRPQTFFFPVSSFPFPIVGLHFFLLFFPSKSGGPPIWFLYRTGLEQVSFLTLFPFLLSLCVCFLSSFFIHFRKSSPTCSFMVPFSI